MKQFIIILSITLLLYNCSGNSTENNYEVIDIEAAFENNQGLNLSQYASAIRYIPLETSEEALIGRTIQDIVTDNNHFYILSANMGKYAVLMFDNNGNFIKKIGNQGRGPGEYNSIRALLMENDADSALSVYTGRKMMSYKDEVFVKEFSMDGARKATRSMIASDCRYASKGRYEFISTQKDTANGITRDIYILLDSTGKVLNTALIGNTHFFTANIGEHKAVINQSAVFFKNTERPLFINSTGDTISCISENMNRIVSYVLHLGKYKNLAEEDNFADILQIGRINNNNTNKFLTIGFMAPAQRLPFIFGTSAAPINKVAGRIVYDKNIKQTYILKYDPEYKISGFNNDLDGGAPFIPIYAIGNKMYQFTDAATFIEYANKSTSQQMKEIASKLTEESNPVLTEITLK